MNLREPIPPYQYLIMKNENDGKCIRTRAKLDGPVFKKYIIEGYRPVCWIIGFGSRISNITDDEWEQFNEIKP